MKHRFLGTVLIVIFFATVSMTQNLRQSYSGKFGYYAPSDGLNDGLLLGADGITEFLHYDFFLNLAADLYLKKTFNFFKDPKPQIVQQQIVLIPLGGGAAYKLFDVTDADSRGYAGLGAGYYLYFYSVDYRSSAGGLLGGSLTSESDNKNGGRLFATIFLRALIGKIFIEPRYFFAAKDEDSVGSHPFIVNPSGFSLMLGYQY
ncbi:MAG: hypothetical protein HYW57_07410 [Ignavibacteriales bacterium]|nr:hypothetical protein [Ignavibacteriales bacterium]